MDGARCGKTVYTPKKTCNKRKRIAKDTFKEGKESAKYFAHQLMYKPPSAARAHAAKATHELRAAASDGRKALKKKGPTAKVAKKAHSVEHFYTVKASKLYKKTKP
jgi:hypothetical protein